MVSFIGGPEDKGEGHVKTSVKVALVTAAVGIPAFFLGPVLFQPADVGVEPTADQLPFFLFLAVGDALLLGLGVSFLLLGFPVMRKVSPDFKVRTWAMYRSIGYLMVSTPRISNSELV
jgi:hypothetical protein